MSLSLRVYLPEVGSEAAAKRRGNLSWLSFAPTAVSRSGLRLCVRAPQSSAERLRRSGIYRRHGLSDEGMACLPIIVIAMKRSGRSNLVGLYSAIAKSRMSLRGAKPQRSDVAI